VTRVARDLHGLIENTTRDGRIARSRGVARDHNPHGDSTDRYPIMGAGAIDGMLHAWWRGWDQTDSELQG